MQIDLDSNASTRLDPRVLSRMNEVAATIWGNPSSKNKLGNSALCEVCQARLQVAQLINANENEVLFTSGATESINLALQGIVRAHGNKPVHIITSNVEHKAVLETLNYLNEAVGVQVTYIKSDQFGRVDPEQIRSKLRDETVLVCLIHGSNEIGTINDVARIGSIIKESSRALFFVDASQTGAYCPPDVRVCRIDLLALSAHKMYGPKGIGALFVQDGVRFEPLMFGGGQERGFRPGTINTPAVASFGTAAQIARTEGLSRSAHLADCRDRFLGRFIGEFPDVKLNGDPYDRTPSNISLTIPYVEAQTLMMMLPHLAFSQSSACTSITQRPSHVLQAIGHSDVEIQWTVRIGLSWFTTEEEIEITLRDLTRVVHELRLR